MREEAREKNKDFSKEYVKEYIRTKDILFRYARGIQEPPRKESHIQHEIFFLLKGEAELISESGRKTLTSHTLAVIPGETFHQIIPGSRGADYCRCVFKMEKIGEFAELIQIVFQKVRILYDSRITEIFLKLEELALSGRSRMEEEILVKAYLAQLLVLINDNAKEQLEIEAFQVPVTREVIAYINRNLDKDLSLEVLADRFHVSSSYLSGVFKKDMHVSVHKYIMEKRLIMANEKIRKGAAPVKVAMECGFFDYSNFYIQYKKRFGAAPSRSMNVPPFG